SWWPFRLLSQTPSFSEVCFLLPIVPFHPQSSDDEFLFFLFYIWQHGLWRTFLEVFPEFRALDFVLLPRSALPSAPGFFCLCLVYLLLFLPAWLLFRLLYLFFFSCLFFLIFSHPVLEFPFSFPVFRTVSDRFSVR